MGNPNPQQFKNYKFIVSHPDLLGGKLTIRGTRISVSHILECLAAGLTVDNINESFETNFIEEVIARSAESGIGSDGGAGDYGC